MSSPASENPSDASDSGDSPDTPSTGTGGSTAGGAKWGLLSIIAQQGGAVVVTTVLARILAPEEFGLVAATNVVTLFFIVCGQVGFGPSLVSRDTVNSRIINSAFWATFIAGVALSVVCAAASTPLAALLGQPKAQPLIAAASVTILLAMLSTVAKSLLLRRRQFREHYLSVTAGAVAYLGVAIALALLTDLGAWVIILGRIAQGAAMLICQMIWSRLLPRFELDMSVIREDMGFSGGIFMNYLTQYGSKNVDFWIVSRAFGATSLGVYYIAYALPNILRLRLTILAGELLLPTFAERRNSTDELADAYQRALGSLMFIAVPGLVGVAVLSSPIIEIFFGPAWGEADQLMSILSITAAVEVVNQVTNTLLIGIRRPGSASRVNLVRVAVLTVGALIGAIWLDSLTFIAGAVLASAFAMTIVGTVQLQYVASIAPRYTLAACLPSVIGSTAMAAAMIFTEVTVDIANPFGEIAVVGLVGAVAFLAVEYIGFPRSLREAVQLARGVAGK